MESTESTTELDILKEMIEHSVEQTLNPKKYEHIQEEIDLMYSYAYNFYRGGKFQKAATVFLALTNIDPKDTASRQGLAASYKMSGEHEKALEAYCILALIDSSDPMTHAHAADCCFALGQIPRGMLALESAERLAAGKEKYQMLQSQLALIKKAWSNKDLIHSNKET
jgi:tetratricopeptide (TPR) repeat protein